MLGLLLVFVVLSILAVVVPDRRSSRGSVRLARMILCLLFVYAALLFESRVSVRVFNVREARYYWPLYMGLCLLWLFDLAWLHARLAESFERANSPWRRRVGPLTLRVVWAGAFVSILTLHAVQAWKWARESYSEGLGYANVSWHESEILETLRNIPEGTPVASNSFDAVYVLTGRITYPFPRGVGEAAVPTGLTRSEEWRQTLDLLEEDGGLLAAFHLPTRRGLVEVDEIGDQTLICPLWKFEEGEIYRRCEEGLGPALPRIGAVASPPMMGRRSQAKHVDGVRFVKRVCHAGVFSAIPASQGRQCAGDERPS
jgi:hypothetical protein